MAVRFGATIVQVVPFPLLRDDFVFAESIGLDNAWVIDQFGIDSAPEVALGEAWTTLAGLASETERIRVISKMPTAGTSILRLPRASTSIGAPSAWARALGRHDERKGMAANTVPTPAVTAVATPIKCRLLRSTSSLIERKLPAALSRNP